MKKIKIRKEYYIVLLLVLAAAIFFIMLVNYSARSIDDKNTTVIVDIPTGSSFMRIRKF
jgi:uncharacterized membrane protein YhaH (DUF805 family)